MNEKNVVLITGGTGFIGYRVAKRMLDDDYSVHLLVRPNSDLIRLGQLRARVHIHVHDGSTPGLIEIVKAVRPQSVLHLASLFIAEHKPDNVDALLVNNVLFGTQLLEAMIAVGVRRFVNTGTSWQHFHSEVERPSCLYAATKQAFQDILCFYSDAYELRAVTLKLFDTYGPEDHRRKLFWALRQAAKTGAPLPMSAGEQQIDLVYIDDVVEAFRLAEARVFNETGVPHESFGVSSGHPMPLRKVVELYQGVLGRDVPIRWGARPYRKREVMVSSSNLPTLPGWKPETDLLTGLRKMQALDGVPGGEATA